MNKLRELNQLCGTIEYGYYSNIHPTSEPECYIESFHSLDQLQHLLDKTKINEIKKRLDAVQIEIEAVCFNSKTCDSNINVELLLMKDEFYGEILERT
ncbi:hypothetical protein [Bacillus changyiensis]|uniref:hypothetical protein n=1 Tax=Bacillus changyiensis TaxID=3004103 RepID=UPI0022E3C381|nr:hypothetical protein [Bacillus changyiensis]MDA1476080.1 hypothetical protein [Bacillus changyiensis]